MNFFRTALLLAALTGFFLVVGYVLGGQTGLILAVRRLGDESFAYWNSDRMVLRMANAHEVGPDQAPQLYGIVEQLTQRAGLPMPRVYLIDDGPAATLLPPAAVPACRRCRHDGPAAQPQPRGNHRRDRPRARPCGRTVTRSP